MMSGVLLELEAVTNEVLRDAKLDPKDIDVVMRTGGSSLIAVVRDQLESGFPAKVTEHDPFTSVAVGLAIASYYDFQFHAESA